MLLLLQLQLLTLACLSQEQQCSDYSTSAQCENIVHCFYDASTRLCRDLIEVNEYGSHPRLFILAGHGGTVSKFTSRDEPDRCTDVMCHCPEGFDCPASCQRVGDCTLAGDPKTDYIAASLAQKLHEEQGLDVGVVVNHLHREYMDVNRPKDNQGNRMSTVPRGNGTWCVDDSGEIEGEMECEPVVLDEDVGSIWDKFHNETESMLHRYCGNGGEICLVFDLHAVIDDNVHLGMRTNRATYTGPVAEGATFLSDISSVYNLLAENDQLERFLLGEDSMSHILNGKIAEEFGSRWEGVVLPYEGMTLDSSDGYFSGGYITGKYSFLGASDVIQMEIPPTMRSFRRNHVKKYVKVLSEAVSEYFQIWKSEIDGKIGKIQALSNTASPAWSQVGDSTRVNCDSFANKANLTPDETIYSTDITQLCAEACAGQKGCTHFSVNSEDHTESPGQCMIYEDCEVSTKGQSYPYTKTIYEMSRDFEA